MVTVNPVDALASPFPLAFFEVRGMGPEVWRWWPHTVCILMTEFERSPCQDIYICICICICKCICKCICICICILFKCRYIISRSINLRKKKTLEAKSSKSQDGLVILGEKKREFNCQESNPKFSPNVTYRLDPVTCKLWVGNPNSVDTMMS